MSTVNSQVDRNDGFVYSITNEKGVQSHIVGTIHIATRAMAQNTRLFDLLRGAGKLYTESGYDMALFGPYCNGLHRDKGDPLSPGYSIDGSMVFEAIRRNVPVRNLDDLEQNPELGELVEKMRQVAALQGPKKLFQNRIKVCNDPDVRQQMMIWKNANARVMEAEVRIMESSGMSNMVSERNQLWLQGYSEKNKKGLLQIVQEAKKPVCIAVGAAHLFGDKGLLTAFKNAGYVVRAIPPAKSSRPMRSHL